MFLTPSTVTINLSTGVVTPSDPVSARKTLAVTLTGTGSATVQNQRIALYRLCRNGIDGTLVATGTDLGAGVQFSGPANNFIGTMSLNTAELVKAFTDMTALRQYEVGVFKVLVYDASDTIYTIFDDIAVTYEYPLAAGTPPNVSPIVSGTTIWGNMKLENGGIYLWNADTGLWNLLTSRGPDNQQHLELGDGANI